MATLLINFPTLAATIPSNNMAPIQQRLTNGGPSLRQRRTIFITTKVGHRSTKMTGSGSIRIDGWSTSLNKNTHSIACSNTHRPVRQGEGPSTQQRETITNSNKHCQLPRMRTMRGALEAATEGTQVAPGGSKTLPTRRRCFTSLGHSPGKRRPTSRSRCTEMRPSSTIYRGNRK